MSNQTTISQNELQQLLELKKQVELRKAKAVAASQKSRQLRMAKMSDEELELYKAKNAAASRKSNEKKRLRIAEMEMKLAQYEKANQE